MGMSRSANDEYKVIVRSRTHGSSYATEYSVVTRPLG